MKLLIADDEDTVRNGIAKYIRLHTDRFEKIYTAENGQQALELIMMYRPELMLLDVRMPLKSGLEVMQEAKKLGIMPITILLSGYDEFAYAQQALRYGARDYLLKPTRSSDILKYLLRFANEISGMSSHGEDQRSEGLPPLVTKATEYIEAHYNENLTLQQVAEQIGITGGYLSTLFAQNLNRGFVEYLNEVRIEHACTYLQQNYLKTYEIAYKVGFNDEKYFSRVFKKIKGESPAAFRKMKIE